MKVINAIIIAAIAACSSPSPLHDAGAPAPSSAQVAPSSAPSVPLFAPNAPASPTNLRPRVFGFSGPIGPQGGTITSVLPATGGGLAGGGASGPVTLGLITCGTNVGLINNGAGSWVCAPSTAVVGTGSTNDLVKWTSATTVGNSSAADNGTTFSINNENVMSIRNVGAAFTSANASWDGFDTTAMAQNVGGSIIFEGNYTSGGSHTALGGIKALKENATSGDFGGDLWLGARQNGSGDITGILMLRGSDSSVFALAGGGFYVQDTTPTAVIRLVTSSGTTFVESGTSTGTSAAPLQFASMNGSISYGGFDAAGNWTEPHTSFLAKTIVEGQNTNSPPGNLAGLELFLGRQSGGTLVNANQTVADVAFDYGGAGGGYRHWVSTEHDTTAANNKMRFWVNNSATAGGSSAPGTGNVEVLRLAGDGSTTVVGGLFVNGGASLSNVTVNGSLTSTSGANTFGEIIDTVQTTSTSSAAIVADFALGANTRLIRWNDTVAPTEWVGMTGGFDGREVYVENVGTSSMQIFTNNSNELTAANQFDGDTCTGGCFLMPHQFAKMVYNGTSTRWVMSIMWSSNSPSSVTVNGTLAVTSTALFDSTIDLSAGANNYIVTAQAISSGNSNINIDAGGTGTIIFNSNTASVANSGTGGLQLWAGANSTNVVWAVDGTGDIITNNFTGTAGTRMQFLGKDTQGNSDNTNGVGVRMGVNTTGRRSIMLYDTANGTLNTTNTALDFTVGPTTGAEINAVSTGWTLAQQLSINASTLILGVPLTLFNTTGDVLYVSSSGGVDCLYNTNASGVCEYNNNGYANGQTQFRGFRVRDGKGNIQFEISPAGMNNDVLITPPVYGSSTSTPLSVGDGINGYNAYASKHYEWNDDWLNVAGNITTPAQTYIGTQYQIQSSGAIGVNHVTGVTGRPGIVQLSASGTTAGAYANILTDIAGIYFPDGNYTFQWVGGVEALSSSSNAVAAEYVVVIGFYQTPSSPNQGFGCFFLYDKANFTTGGANPTNLDKLECECDGGSINGRTVYLMDGTHVSDESFTTVNAPVGALTYPNTNILNLKIVMTGTTRAEFFVNGTKSCDINTHLPSVAGQQVGAGFGIWSEAATGTGSELLDTDFTSLQLDLTSARSP